MTSHRAVCVYCLLDGIPNIKCVNPHHVPERYGTDEQIDRIKAALSRIMDRARLRSEWIGPAEAMSLANKLYQEIVCDNPPTKQGAQR